MSTDASAARLNLIELLGTEQRGSSRSRQQSGAKRKKAASSAKKTVAPAPAKPVEVKPVPAKPVATKPAEAKPAPEAPSTSGLSLIAAEALADTTAVAPTATNTVTHTITNLVTQIETLTNTVTQVETLTNMVTQVETLTNLITQVDVVTNTVTHTLTNTVTQIETLTNTVLQVEVVTNEVTLVVSNKAARTDADRALRGVAPKRDPGPPRISASKVYYDRKGGYSVFSGKVHVDSEEYQLHAKKAYVFFTGTNELKRIVATGNVAITNASKRAYGTKASYYRDSGMVVLYGDRKTAAEVRDEAKEEDQVVKGSKIKFWTTSEQVEVIDAHISSPTTGGMNALKGELKLK